MTVRLLHTAEAVRTILASFESIETASEAVSAIIAGGIIPAALEMLDELMIQAINAGTGAAYPKDAGAVLLIELDGPRAEVEAQAERVAAICRERGALDVRVARDEAERYFREKRRKLRSCEPPSGTCGSSMPKACSKPRHGNACAAPFASAAKN